MRRKNPLAKQLRSIAARDHFPGYPKLKRVIYDVHYGRMELIEVSQTSDGYLIGMAKIGEGADAYVHSVFLHSAETVEGA